MNLRDRIGVDLGRRIRLEEGIEWAARNGVKFIDVQLDTAENALPTFDAKRCSGVRKQLDKHGVKLGLHTLSAVNVAEYSPHVADAVTEYLKSYVDIFRNGHEVHLKPGAGDLDFGRMFKLIERKGFKGHYTSAFGTLEDMLAARDYLVDKARTAGVKVD